MDAAYLFSGMSRYLPIPTTADNEFPVLVSISMGLGDIQSRVDNIISCFLIQEAIGRSAELCFRRCVAQIVNSLHTALVASSK
jgi:hypothetical protein